MTRSSQYFTSSCAVLPPRGGRVELAEIRPLRPNQDLILPGVGVTGRGIRFEVRERTKYRSRSGFAQCGGITQFSGDFVRRSASSSPSPAPPTLLVDPYYDEAFDPRRDVRLPHSATHRSQDQQLSIFDPFLGSHHPQNLHYSKSSHHLLQPPFTSPSLSPRLSPSSSFHRRPRSNQESNKRWELNTFPRRLKTNNTSTANTNFQRRPKKPESRYQNYVYVSDNDEDCSIRRTKGKNHNNNNTTLSRGKSSKGARRRSGAAAAAAIRQDSDGEEAPVLARLKQKEAASRPTSREGINGAYDFLFERHVRALVNLESDASDGEPSPTKEEDDDAVEDQASLTESEQLSVIGDELVEQSISDVAGRLMKNGLSNGGSPTGGKKVSFGPETKEDKKQPGAKEEGE